MILEDPGGLLLSLKEVEICRSSAFSRRLGGLLLCLEGLKVFYFLCNTWRSSIINSSRSSNLLFSPEELQVFQCLQVTSRSSVVSRAAVLRASFDARRSGSLLLTLEDLLKVDFRSDSHLVLVDTFIANLCYMSQKNQNQKYFFCGGFNKV